MSDPRPSRLFIPWRHLIVWGAAVATVACNGGETPPQAAGGPGAGGPPGVPVAIAVIQPSQINDTSEYIGTLKALRSTSVHPEVEGYITRLSVKSGDRVQPGSPIAQIDQARQQAAVASQQATVASGEADVAYARQQFDRLKDLYDQRVVSKAELDQAETALKTAEAALGATNAQVRERQVELRYFQIVAPTAGVIGDIPVRVGDRVTGDTEITTIDSNDQLEILVPVPGERAADLRVGLPLELLGPDGSVMAQTTATFVSPRVDSETQSVLVKGLLKNPGQLRSQQFIKTRVIWSTREGLTVPVLAVTRVGGQSFVFVVEQQDGKDVARQRPVKLGAIVGDAYTVVDGVKAGDRVVVSGVQKLGDGVPVSPMPS